MIETTIVSICLLQLVAKTHVEDADEEESDNGPDKDDVIHNPTYFARAWPGIDN